MPVCARCGHSKDGLWIPGPPCYGPSRSRFPPLPGQRLYIALPSAGGRGSGHRGNLPHDRPTPPTSIEPAVGGNRANGLQALQAYGGHHPLYRETSQWRLLRRRRHFQPISYGAAAGFLPDGWGEPIAHPGDPSIRSLCDHDPAGLCLIREKYGCLHRHRRRTPLPWRGECGR